MRRGDGDSDGWDRCALNGCQRVARATVLTECFRLELLRDVDVVESSSPLSRWLKLEAAAAEVQDAAFGGALSDAFGKRVQMPAAGFLDLQQTGFAEDPQMFGHVVLRDADQPRDFADVERRVHQQADDPNPGVLAERFQCDDAVRIDGGGALAGWLAI